MLQAHPRHDISDHVWGLLEPHLPGRKGIWGGRAKDNRLFINAVFWILRTGAPWRDLPPDYGDWKNTHRRFSRWRDKKIWEKLFEQLVKDPDYEWLLIDATHIKEHLTGLEQKEVIKIWGAQKGAQHKVALGRGCAWYAGQNGYYIRYRSRLFTSSLPY